MLQRRWTERVLVSGKFIQVTLWRPSIQGVVGYSGADEPPIEIENRVSAFFSSSGYKTRRLGGLLLGADGLGLEVETR